MALKYQICFSENMRKNSSSRSQLAVINYYDYTGLEAINREKEKVIPAYTSVMREQERNKLSKN